MRRWTITTVSAILLLLVTACGGVSDTGFRGRWRRDTAVGPSTISLWEADGRWRISWSVTSDTRTIRCDDEGVCDESMMGETTYRWTFRVSEGAGGSTLEVRVEGAPVGDVGTPLSELRIFRLADGGLELVATILERNGSLLDPPAGPYRYVKVSDRPQGAWW